MDINLIYTYMSSGGTEEVSDSVLNTFIEYITSLASNCVPRAARCLYLLNTHSQEHTRDKVDGKQNMSDDDMNSLDFLLCEDISQLSFLSLCYLRAIADHHQLPSYGSRTQVEDYVRIFYKGRKSSLSDLSGCKSDLSSYVPDDDDMVGLCLDS